MPSPDKLFPLIVILGPTAVGKTSLSLQLAEELNGEIVSADSRLFYRGMDIGTAKPSLADRERIPHHLIDIAEPDDVWSLAKFQRAAYAAIADICSRGRLPFLVGGTGQYIWSVVEGWDIPEVKPDSQLRAALQKWGDEMGPLALHGRLQFLDPLAASQIQPQNMRRTIRALEVILHTGALFSDQKKRSGSIYQHLIVGLNRPRPELYKRVDARISLMFQSGFIEEVRLLLDRGFSPSLPPLSAIGYRQVIDFLAGEITLEDAQTQMKRITRQFVRRQANWFKPDDPNIHWFLADVDVYEAIINMVLTWRQEIDFFKR